MRDTILVVDDDKKIVELLRLYLERAGYEVLAALDGRQALELAQRRAPDLIVLDLMLPSVDGLEICRSLRAESSVPIIILTARTAEDDRLLGLDLGADDYIVKPFSPREVVARVRAVLRRAGDQRRRDGPSTARAGDLEVHFASHTARLRGTALQLTPKEFRLLEVLIKEPGRVFSRLDLLDRVFGLDYDGLERTVDVHVMNLRKKIEADPARPALLLTVYGFGYKFTEHVHVA